MTIDLLYGTAGTLLTLVRLYAVTGDATYLADARAAGDTLVGAAVEAPSEGGCYWDVDKISAGGPAAPYLGLLHGAAGIGLALAELARVTGDERYLRAALSAAGLLLGQAIPGAGSTMAWPRMLGDKTRGLQAHCHGAGGIGQFFLRLDRINPDPRYREAAEGAALTVASQRRHESRSCVCHGLSGAGNLLIDCYQATGNPRWLAFARDCAAELGTFREPEHAGVYRITRERLVSPDLMLGYAGVGSFLLRLANPETAPDIVLG